MSYSYSRKPDLPVTQSSPLSTWLNVLFFLSSPAKTTLSRQGNGFCWGRRLHCHRNCPIPIIICVLYCKHQVVLRFCLTHFYGCLRLGCLDVETNLGPQSPVPAVCRILCSNVRGLAGNLSDLTVASSQYDILLCSGTLV